MQGIRIFEVGGSLRDEILGVSTSDRDFCVESEGGWDGLLSWAKSRMNKIYLVTPEYFTIRGQVPDCKEPVDLVMCRVEDGYNGRHPSDVEPGTLLDDLGRRDFTMNAIAREVDSRTFEPIGEMIDPYAGVAATRSRILSCVGSSEQRFEEDLLRVVRAFRFTLTKSATVDSDIEFALVRDGQAWARRLEAAIREKDPVTGKSKVSIERVREELRKMFIFSTPGALRVLQRFHPAFSDVFFAPEFGLWLAPSLAKK